MTQPPSTAVPPVVSLVLRVLTLIFLFLSVIVIATTTGTANGGGEAKFSDFHAYRYVLASGVIGMVYTLLQTAFTVYFTITGNRVGGDGLILFDFYGDKVMSYWLATGAAAGFGLTVDMQEIFTDSDSKSFLSKANAATSLLLFGFLCSAVSSVFSSLSLPKRP